jgi:carbamoyltransferase
LREKSRGATLNEPVVCKPQEALDCFLRRDMDVLVMDNVMMSRSRAT